jgi:hypothetical protein
LTITLTNVAVVDQFKFPGGAGNNLGIAGVPATVSFKVTYQKSGEPRIVRPTSDDPLSPFNWAGKMSMATNSGTFSVSYNDGSFAAQGSFSSGTSNFGEMGTERNGSFVEHEDRDEAGKVAGGRALPRSATQPTSLAATQSTADVPPKLRGRVPPQYLIH